MDVIIFGVGSTWKKEKNYLSKDMNIVGYMDNYANDSEIIRPGDLIKGGYSFDKILICVVFEHRFNMVNQLLDLGIPKEKIGFIEEFHKSYNYKTEIIDKGVIRINKNNIFIDCYNYLELMIATEVIVGNTYNYNTDEDYYVIDIGMNIGSASLFFAGQKNVKAVYGFEPGKYAYDRAISNFSLNPDIKNKIHPYNIALGKVDGTEEYFYHVGEDRAAGIKKVQENVLEELFDKLQTQTINIKQTSSFLENIIKKHNETAVLKMDCEGAEYGILEDLIDSGMIDKIDVIMMEWHDGQAEYLKKLLKDSGFRFVLSNEYCVDFGKCYAWKQVCMKFLIRVIIKNIVVLLLQKYGSINKRRCYCCKLLYLDWVLWVNAVSG